jgi:hypothetical protein
MYQDWLGTNIGQLEGTYVFCRALEKTGCPVITTARGAVSGAKVAGQQRCGEGKRLFLSHFYIIRPFYQDRLGTNIRKTPKKYVFSGKATHGFFPPRLDWSQAFTLPKVSNTSLSVSVSVSASASVSVSVCVLLYSELRDDVAS